jgi:hypothetical protein
MGDPHPSQGAHVTRHPLRRRGFASLAFVGVAAMTFAFTPATEPTVADAAFRPQLVTVDTPTREHKELLQTLGLDLTEHAGHDYVEVVLHTAADRDAIEAAGLTSEVRIPDLRARTVEVQRMNREYAARMADTGSPMPSGRTTYRTLEDYNAEIDEIAAAHPDITKKIELNHTSLEGRPVFGLEIGEDVHRPETGRPVFVMLGLHHAREWPSGEHTIEFAYDLVQGYDNDDERITALLDNSRAIIVPVVNVDGFKRSIDDAMVDLREADSGGIASILGSPSNAYKRKNCRVIDGQEPAGDECAALKSPGGFGVGIDLNRNYGAFHGGPGASNQPPDPTYHGPTPFSEPETQNIRELVSSRQVTGLVTNHTFSNLILRPNGVAPDTIGPDGHPIGFAPDEEAMKRLGAKMAFHNGYTNQHGWELYDTTGTTEDYSYNATGGYGYTFEIGANEFHPPYEQVVAEYTGDTEAADEHVDDPGITQGNGEAFLLAYENAVNWHHHAVLTGKAPQGATLRLTRVSSTPTWEASFQDRVDTTIAVTSNSGRFTWHVNPSTRPLAESRQIRVLGGEPTSEFEESGTVPPPTQHVDVPYTLEEGVTADVLDIRLTWDLPDDMDLEVYKVVGEELEQVGSSGAFVGEKERVLLEDAEPGDYVIRVINFASASPTWTVTAETFTSDVDTVSGVIEAWTLSCEVDGEVLQQVPVIVDRHQIEKVDLGACIREARKG